jgi:hypothetical protein
MASSGLKVLLQDRKTSRFYGGASEWVGEPERAQNFESTVNALDFARRKRMVSFRIVLKFGWDEYDLHFEY